ncbi:MAG TPA: hypothetical protein VIK14_01725 [Ignavibacteria bacterium]
MKTNLNFITIIILFSLLLPVSLFAQLSDNEREDLSAYINNNSSMLNYALNLRTKLLNDVEFSKNLKSCSKNISTINFVKDNNTFFNEAVYREFIPLKETTDKIMNKMTYNFLIEVFPEYKTFKDDISWLSNKEPVYVNAYSSINMGVADNFGKLGDEYVNYRNLFNAQQTIEHIQVAFAQEYFLKTIFPSRKYTNKYIKKKNKK